jgi:hypothetical protein
MKSETRFNTIIAVGFALALILCSGGAQAGNLLGLGSDRGPRTAAAGPSAGLFEQASAWLLGAWAEVESAFAGALSPPLTPTAADCDAGWGLDPEGCPNPQ